MPEGPAVAGLEPLCQCADPVDRANGPTESDGAVGTHQRRMTALGVDKARASRDEATLDECGEGDPRCLARGHERCQALCWQWLDRCDALARRCRVGSVALEPDEAAAQELGDRAGCSSSGEWIEHEVVGTRGGENHPREQ